MEDDVATPEEAGTISRRAFVGAAVGATASVASSATASAQATRTIDMTDNLVFDPDDVTIAPGTTVVWENVGQVGHSVTAYQDDIPEDAAYFASGGFSNEDAARNGYPGQGDIPGGESFSHTFEVTGTYEYFCIPHESVGMLGTIEVVEGGGGEETATGPLLPDSALTLGVATTVALVSVVGLAYFFLKYSGDYEMPGEKEE
jgi:plastocyanin